jgi:hypothetical protein
LDLLDPNNAIIGNEFAAIYSEIVGLFAEWIRLPVQRFEKCLLCSSTPLRILAI